MTDRDITPEQLDQKLTEICTAHPGNRNPWEPDVGCLYTDTVDPTKHCLIGQFLAEHDPYGLSVAMAGESAHTLFRRLGYSHETARMASDWQAVADKPTLTGLGSEREPAHTWGKTKSAMHRRRGRWGS